MICRWYHEVIDILRRVFFVGVIPLMCEDPVNRAYVGCAAALVSVTYFREFLPYRDASTNIMAVIAQYQVCILSLLYFLRCIQSEPMRSRFSRLLLLFW